MHILKSIKWKTLYESRQIVKIAIAAMSQSCDLFDIFQYVALDKWDCVSFSFLYSHVRTFGSKINGGIHFFLAFRLKYWQQHAK